MRTVVPGEPANANLQAISMSRVETGRGRGPDTSWNSEHFRSAFPRFLLMNRQDGGNFDSLGPFELFRMVKSIVGEVKDCRKTRTGLLFEVNSAQHANKLLALKEFNSASVIVSPHKTLNSCKGVVSDRELKLETDESLKLNFEEQGVVDVRRIKKRNTTTGQLEDTQSVILTFNGTTLPSKIKLGWIQLDVRPYIPNPLRCFLCQHYNHPATRCPKKDLEPVCACGKPRHEGKPCTEPFDCPNCHGPHLAFSRQCPQYIKEAQVERTRVLENLSYAEARKRVGTTTQNTSYASVTASHQGTHPFDMKSFIKELTPVLTEIVQQVVKQVLKEKSGIGESRRGISTSMESIASQQKRPASAGDDSMDTAEDSSAAEPPNNQQKHRQKKKKVTSPRPRIPPLTTKLRSNSKTRNDTTLGNTAGGTTMEYEFQPPPGRSTPSNVK